MTKSQLSRYLRAAFVTGGLTTLALSGCSTSDEARRASSLAGGCSINSDCEEDYICAFERCHIPCTQDRDCDPDPLRCVKSETTDIFVCQLEDETHCKTEKDCPGDQVCGVDEECRDACEEHGDCIGDQICAASNECASVVSSKDTVDPEGNIIPEDDPVGGSGGTGNTAGTSGSGGTGASSSGGTGMGGVPAEPTAGDGAGGADITGEAGSGPGNEAGGPNLPPVEFEETADGIESVENDSREQAVTITQSARFFVDEDTGDEDWFAYQAPDDGHPHLLTLLFDQDDAVSTVVRMLMAEDGTAIGSDRILDKGTTRSVYVTVGPNTLTYFGLWAWSTGSEGFVHLTLTDEPEPDVHEPNNTPEQAAPITLGETVTGMLTNPQQSASVDLAQDWFEVELAQGTATFTFTTLPGEGRASATILRPGATAGAVIWSPGVGMPEAKDVTVNTAGVHRFNVKIYNDGAVPASAVTVKPKYFYQPYSFTITQ